MGRNNGYYLSFCLHRPGIDNPMRIRRHPEEGQWPGSKNPGKPTPELNQSSIGGRHPSCQRVLREPGVRGFHPRPLRWLRLRVSSGFRDFGQFPGGFAARRQGRTGCAHRPGKGCIRRARSPGSSRFRIDPRVSFDRPGALPYFSRYTNRFLPLFVFCRSNHSVTDPPSTAHGTNTTGQHQETWPQSPESHWHRSARRDCRPFDAGILRRGFGAGTTIKGGPHGDQSADYAELQTRNP